MFCCHSEYYLHGRVVSGEGIVSLGITVCVCVHWATCITYRLHAALVSVEKIMHCIQCSLVKQAVGEDQVETKLTGDY